MSPNQNQNGTGRFAQATAACQIASAKLASSRPDATTCSEDPSGHPARTPLSCASRTGVVARSQRARRRGAVCPPFPRGSWERELTDRREKLVARVLAATAGFGAEPAVLVVGGVPVALLGTGDAGHCTGFDHCTEEREIRSGLAGHERPVASQASAQSRQSRIQRTIPCTSSSARSASAQLVQLAAQSMHASIQRNRAPRSGAVGWDGIEHLLKGHLSPSFARQNRP